MALTFSLSSGAVLVSLVPKTHQWVTRLVWWLHARMRPVHPPFPFLLLRMPQALVPFDLGSSHILLLLDFLTCDCSAPFSFPILCPCPTIPSPCWNNAWSKSISSPGPSGSQPRQISHLFSLHSLTNRLLHTQCSTLRWLWSPGYLRLYVCVPY